MLPTRIFSKVQSKIQIKLIVYESPVRVGRELSYRKNIGLIILEGRVQKKENILYFDILLHQNITKYPISWISSNVSRRTFFLRYIIPSMHFGSLISNSELILITNGITGNLHRSTSTSKSVGKIMVLKNSKEEKVNKKD